MSSTENEAATAKKERIEQAAKRALEEAKTRKTKEKNLALTPEKGGQEGPEPTRFGDWEKGGLISDF